MFPRGTHNQRTGDHENAISSHEQKAPMTLGICTRNVGPAIAPLFAVPGSPQGAITMCVMAIFLGTILSGFAAAAVLRRFCAPAGVTQQEGAP